MGTRISVDQALLGMKREVVTRTLKQHGIVLRSDALDAMTVRSDLRQYHPWEIEESQKVKPGLALRAFSILRDSRLRRRIDRLLFGRGARR
jgi:hypothetical protein